MGNSIFKKKLYKFLELFLDVVILIFSFNFATISVGEGLIESIRQFFILFKNEFITTPLEIISNNVALALQNVAIIIIFIIISRIYRTSLIEKKYSKAMYSVFIALVVSNLIVTTHNFYAPDGAAPATTFMTVSKLLKSIGMSFIALAMSRLILWQYVKRKNRLCVAIVSPKENSVELMRKFLLDESNYKTLKYLILEENGNLPDGYEKKLGECDQTYISDDLSSNIKTEIIDYVIYNSNSSLGVIPKYYELAITSSKISRVDDVLALSVKPVSLSLMYKFTKRTLDLIMAVIMLIIMMPLLLITVIVNKLYYRTPVFQFERNITYKLKTFNRVTFNTKSRYKTTAYGRILDYTKISKIPMFYNVLIGQMAVVGLKPHSKAYLTEKEGLESIQFRKNVKAGIISYENMYSNEATKIDDTIRFDVYYVSNASVYEDIKIMLLSFANLFKNKKKLKITGDNIRDIVNSKGYSYVTSNNIYSFTKKSV